MIDNTNNILTLYIAQSMANVLCFLKIHETHTPRSRVGESYLFYNRVQSGAQFIFDKCLKTFNFGAPYLNNKLVEKI